MKKRITKKQRAAMAQNRIEAKERRERHRELADAVHAAIMRAERAEITEIQNTIDLTSHLDGGWRRIEPTGNSTMTIELFSTPKPFVWP